MSDLSNKDLDSIFREGSEQYGFEYNEAAWAQMESKLDAHEQKEKKKKRGFLLFFGLLALLTIGAFGINNEYLRDYSSSPVDESHLSTEQLTTVNQSDQSMDASSKDPKTENISENGSGTNNDELAPSTLNTETITNDKNTTKDSAYRGNDVAIAAKNTTNIDYGIDNNDNVTLKPSPSKSAEGDLLQSPSVVHASKEEQTPISEDTNKWTALDKQEDNNTILPLSNINAELSYKPQFATMQQERSPFIKPQKDHVAGRIAITAFASPEWSVLMNESTPQLGGRFGARVGYQFAQKWEVSIGVALSQKLFAGKGSEYTAPDSEFWVDDVMPMAMEAKGKFFEVPLQATYYIKGYEKSGYFIDLAVNNCALLSQWYGFIYDPLEDRPELMHEWTSNQTAWQNLASGKIAFGYQKVYNNNNALQIAPYIQLPFAGVGEGSVNVYSTGLQVSYKFIR